MHLSLEKQQPELYTVFNIKPLPLNMFCFKCLSVVPNLHFIHAN